MDRAAIAIVRDYAVDAVIGDQVEMNAASLVKQVIAHVALAVFDDLDEPVQETITIRHILAHTTGLPNWRPEGQPLVPIRPPGQRWGYSGEGFVLLMKHLEHTTNTRIDALVEQLVLDPLDMSDSRLDDPEPGYHGYRPLITTASDYAKFLAHVLQLDDARWHPLWPIDDELAWGAGWGIEIGPPTHGWQWGSNDDASNFVIGSPETGDGVVVLTNRADGRAFYRSVVERELPGDHASLRVEHNQIWLDHFR